MIVYLDKSQHQMPDAAAELNIPTAQLLTPLTGYSDAGMEYAIDNGAFKRFDQSKFMSLLERQYDSKARCKFVACPDIPFSARRTLEVFYRWFPKLFGWPIAFVAQDGQEDLEIPWDHISAIFIGGTDAFKVGKAGKEIIRTGKALGKWVHVGRVNTPDRFDFCDWLHVDSIDGTGISRYTHMRKKLTIGMPLLDYSEVQ